MTYNEELVWKVRTGEVQLQCDSDDYYRDLLGHIFQGIVTSYAVYNYYVATIKGKGYSCRDKIYEGLEVVHASQFYPAKYEQYNDLKSQFTSYPVFINREGKRLLSIRKTPEYEIIINDQVVTEDELLEYLSNYKK